MTFTQDMFNMKFQGFGSYILSRLITHNWARGSRISSGRLQVQMVHGRS